MDSPAARARASDHLLRKELLPMVGRIPGSMPNVTHCAEIPCARSQSSLGWAGLAASAGGFGRCGLRRWRASACTVHRMRGCGTAATRFGCLDRSGGPGGTGSSHRRRLYLVVCPQDHRPGPVRRSPSLESQSHFAPFWRGTQGWSLHLRTALRTRTGSTLGSRFGLRMSSITAASALDRRQKPIGRAGLRSTSDLRTDGNRRFPVMGPNRP